ncbi:MAG: DUF4258 domain-containing protein [Candidatus Aureabacteria bacterium]|nr:DUF4258 domain-containing protein [Candidatus Auribacterota bacterium]
MVKKKGKKITKKTIVVTVHAQQRMKQRGIKQDDIQKTLDNPNFKGKINPDKTQKFVRIVGKKREHHVVVTNSRAKYILVTTYWRTK